MDDGYVHEVPGGLKQLARLVARAFYTVEDALIVDMLVRNPCMKEDDICEMLKFDKKLFRTRIATLRTDKFLHTRMKMETIDSKSSKVNYYYINYKTFVNIVKYKLDQMRKRMETSERDATSRASFKCTQCQKPFTDLDVNHLLSLETGDMHCTICHGEVEEDATAGPKSDSRIMVAKFNEQMEPLYKLLKEVEDVKLAPSLLEPEPTDISHLQRDASGNLRNKGAGDNWSGEASRSGGLRVDEQRVDITIGDSATTKKVEVRKEQPVWMTQSTVINETTTVDSNDSTGGAFLNPDDMEIPGAVSSVATNKQPLKADFLSLLMAHETTNTKPLSAATDALNDESAAASSILDNSGIDSKHVVYSDVEEIGSDDDSEADIPMVRVGDRQFPVNNVPEEFAKLMTPAEKDAYVQLYQEYCSNEYY